MHHSRATRLVRLTVQLRLRALGWVPWLLLLGWALLAAAQEPRLLRGFGIRLTDQAAWAGGMVMAVLLFTADRYSLRRPMSFSANLVLTALVASAQAALPIGMDVCFGYAPDLTGGIRSALCFAFACSPLAIALSGPADVTQTVVRIMIMVAAVTCSAAASASFWTVGATVPTLGAVLLCVAGVSLWNTATGKR